MNIFTTHKSPVKSAIYVWNDNPKRGIKMILESFQLMSTAIHLSDAPDSLKSQVYRMTHKNHPSSLWSRQNVSNYNWVLEHALTLGKLYTRYYGKVHKSISDKLDLIIKGSKYMASGDLQPFANCASNSSLPNCDFRNIEDTCKAYRLYLARRKELVNKDKLDGQYD